ncbi:hypothetical protein [Sphingomonas sp.]|uniref:hypothetical protein n=1 Tax=Sphingomonas sp. TaxID=28214 RepID=UPI001B29013B|nr:hypothetical protein [Sphingomonas sp.]MBO9715180.1 hypothetical protein [Sphingomonas sp.]
MKAMLAAAVLLLAPAAANAQTAPAPAAAAPAATAIYDKALVNGWQNWSWATVELSADAGAHKPIKVEAKGWQALYLHHDPFDTTPYRGISLLIQSTGGEASFRIVAVVGGKPVTDPKSPAGAEPIPLGKVVTVTPGGWKQVQVSLRDLGVEKKQIDGFWIQNATAQDAPPVYVADVSLMQ